MSIKANNEVRTGEIQRSLEAHLPFSPTGSQAQAIYVLARLLQSRKPRCAMLLRGYAGTGKTSLMQALVRYQKNQGMSCVLLAPTGRAAKVLGQYTSTTAFTIHRYIYQRSVDRNGKSSFSIRPNRQKRTVYIVDEASMLSDAHSGLGGSLLSDLISHVYMAEGCKLILLGDDAQLPPVGMQESPALDIDRLRADYDLTIAGHLLDEVVRQSRDSSILDLATAIRNRVFSENHSDPKIEYKAGPDVVHLDSRELQESLEEEYDRHGKGNVRIICRSNKSANLFNKQIRSQVFQMDDELCAGEMLMVVRNNYLWAQEEEKMPFIANGEMCELLYSKRHEERYGMRFVTLGLSFVDHEGVEAIECNSVLDSLEAKTPSLPQADMDKLYQEVRTDLSFDSGPAELKSKMQSDPWLNALQVKYGYAVTCHKAQGGQWPVVFIDRGFIPDDGMDREYWRWLYTAVTRATEKVYLLGF